MMKINIKTIMILSTIHNNSTKIMILKIIVILISKHTSTKRIANIKIIRTIIISKINNKHKIKNNIIYMDKKMKVMTPRISFGDLKKI